MEKKKNGLRWKYISIPHPKVVGSNHGPPFKSYYKIIVAEPDNHFQRNILLFVLASDIRATVKTVFISDIKQF